MKPFVIALCLLTSFSFGYAIAPSSFTLADDEKKETKKDEKPKLTEKQKAERQKALREAKKTGTLLKRAQNKIDEYCEEFTLTLSKTIVFYGHNEDGDVDIKVFAAFKDGSLGIYYAGPDPDGDAWMLFEKDSMKDIEIIGHTQSER